MWKGELRRPGHRKCCGNRQPHTPWGMSISPALTECLQLEQVSFTQVWVFATTRPCVDPERRATNGQKLPHKTKDLTFSCYKHWCYYWLVKITKKTALSQARENTQAEKATKWAIWTAEPDKILKILSVMIDQSLRQDPCFPPELWPKQVVLKRQNTNGNGKMLNLTGHQRYANQNYTEMLQHLSENGSH